MTARVQIGTAGSLNLGSGPTRIKVQGILAMIALGGVTLLGMQEGSDRAPLLARLLEVLRHPAAAVRRVVEGRRQRRAIRAELARIRWAVFQPLVPGGKAVPIGYDASAWRVRRARTVTAVARAWVGAMGAGPTWAKTKVIAVLVLEHRQTGEVVEVLNTHFLPSAERGNLPEREQRARRRHYGRHARRLAAIVRRAEKRGHGVVVTTDANATRHSDLIDPLRAVGLVGWTVDGTKGARGIDHVLTVERGRVVGTPAHVVTLRGFDHRGVIRDLYARSAAA